MAKAAKVLCTRCERKLNIGVPFCTSCGYPTRWASQDQRAGWEVAQYNTPRKQAPAAPAPSTPQRPLRGRLANLFGRKAAPRPSLSLMSPAVSRPRAAAPQPQSAGVVSRATPPKPVARPAPQTATAAVPSIAKSRGAVPTAKPAVAPPIAKPPIAAPTPEPPVATAAVKPIARPQPSPPTARPRSPSEPRSAPAPAPRDGEPLRDEPATVRAMRLLNARVAELDAKVRRLEQALAARGKTIDISDARERVTGR